MTAFLHQKLILGCSALFLSVASWLYVIEIKSLHALNTKTLDLLDNSALLLNSNAEKITKLEKIIASQEVIIAKNTNLFITNNKTLTGIEEKLSENSNAISITNDYISYISYGLVAVLFMSILIYVSLPSNQTVESLCKNASLEAGEILQNQVITVTKQNFLHTTTCMTDNLMELGKRITSLEKQITPKVFPREDQLTSVFNINQIDSGYDAFSLKPESLYSIPSTQTNTLSSIDCSLSTSELAACELADTAQNLVENVLPFIT